MYISRGEGDAALSLLKTQGTGSSVRGFCSFIHITLVYYVKCNRVFSANQFVVNIQQNAGTVQTISLQDKLSQSLSPCAFN